jgi:hypothetical protein
MSNSKDFNAKQAKYIADKQYIQQINECLVAIKREAEKGKYKVEIKDELHENCIFKLKDLGFNVVNHIPADRKGKEENIYHTIAWKYV